MHIIKKLSQYILTEVLIYYFASVFTIEDTYNPRNNTNQSNFIPLSDRVFTEDAVTKTLDRIKVNKSSGPNCITLKIFEDERYQISKPLLILFNKSLNSGKVPDIWKLARLHCRLHSSIV